MRTILITLFAAIGLFSASAADPTQTRYTSSQCEGSYMPYPATMPQAVPDSLEAVFINHVGRHGARFPSSAKNINALSEALSAAESAGTITPAGREMKRLCRLITDRTAGRWGALDSIGVQEQCGIAQRMYSTFPALFEQGRVEALSSYSPRCIMSMYTFAHQLSRMNNRLEIFTNSGRQNSPLMRPFDSDASYIEYREERSWEAPITALERQMITDAPIRRILGKGAELSDDFASLAMAEYAVVACASAIGIDSKWETFFTLDEYNRLWSVSNLRHYLQYSASTLSTAPAEMATALLQNLVATLDQAADGSADVSARLRFGHAETLMPLLAMMHLPGCYYMTNYFDTVALHWRDFYIVPMAANLQLILLRHRTNGRLYLRVDLNEQTVPLIPGRSALYTPWPSAREYLQRCLPLLARD